MRNVLWAVLTVTTMLAVAGCGDAARLMVRDGMGTQPVLPPPRHTLLPTMHIVKAVS